MATRPTPSPSPIQSPSTKSSPPLKESGDYSGALWEIGDFLFAARSIAKIAHGKGTWGDAFAAGVSAAAIFIPPLKLGKLAEPALKAVVAESEKMLSTEVVSVVGKKQLEKNINNATTLLNHSEDTRPIIAQQLEDGTFEITKLPLLTKTSGDVQLKNLDPSQRRRALRNADKEKELSREYIDNANAGEIQASESTHPYDVANTEAKAANLEESARIAERNPDALVFRDRENDIPELIDKSTVPGRSQASIDERLNRPTNWWDHVKTEYEKVNKELPSDIKPYSALEPEIDILKTDYELLQHLTTYDISTDADSTSKLVRVLESLAKVEPDEKTKSILESTIADLDVNGTESEVFKKIVTVAQRKLNRIEKLAEYAQDKTGTAFARQTNEIVPVIDKATGKVDWVKPKSYQDFSKVTLSPDRPARSLVSEIESDLSSLRDEAMSLYGKLNDKKGYHQPRLRKRLKEINGRIVTTYKELLKARSSMTPLEIEKITDKSLLTLKFETMKNGVQLPRLARRTVRGPSQTMSRAELRKLRPESKPGRKPTSSRQKEPDYIGKIDAPISQLYNELKITRQQYREIKKSMIDFAEYSPKWVSNKRKLDRLERQGKAINRQIERRKTILRDTASQKPVRKEASEITIHSGGAKGADTQWARIADAKGIKTTAHSFKDHESLGGFMGNRPALETRNVLSREQLLEADQFLERAGIRMDRNFNPDSDYVDLLRRNYYQVKDSKAVIAIGDKFVGGQKVVDGGTGWAVQMGIDMGKSVYVFDQATSSWYRWGGKKFVKIDGLPPAFNSFAGIGTRQLKGNGNRAITEYVEKISGKLSKTTKTANVESAGEVVRLKKLNELGFKRSDVVDIGRSGEFGNPYRVDRNLPIEKAAQEAVKKYRKWLWDKIQAEPEYARKLYELKGKKLACPGEEKDVNCHGQVILKAIKYLEAHPELMEGK